MAKFLESILTDKELWDSTLSPRVLNLQNDFLQNLTKEQQAKIKQLRVATKDVLQPEHTDFFLHKWLKACKFELKDAENMIRNHLKFRKEMELDSLGKGSNYVPAEVLEKYAPFGKYGHDKDGSNIFYINLGNVDIRGIVYSIKVKDFVKYFTIILESVDRMHNRQTELHGKLVTSTNVIVDVVNFKLQDFIWRPIFEIITTGLKVLESHYCYCLKKVFIINAPRIFFVLYAMLKPFLSEDTKSKIIIYGKDGWKEELLKVIDAGQLPVNWGGTAVDEIDGNPYCSSKIGMGGVVPETYYLSKGKKRVVNDKLQSETVDKNSTYKIDFKVDEPGSTITWNFETEDLDIGFGVYFKPDNNSSTEKTYILPVTRVNCSIAPEEGSLLCDKCGIYTIIFDNRYSWYKSKKVLYDVRIAPPEVLVS